MADHSILPPSSAARWVLCAGSVPLEARYADMVDAESAEAAAEGNAAHAIAAQLLRGQSWVVGTPAPNGVITTDEMMEATEMYAADVTDPHHFAVLHVEEVVRANSIHLENWGTPDVWLFVPHGRGGLLSVWDFKYGHRFVDAFENWQLIDYVAGILSKDEFLGMDRRQIDVVMTVVQPRNYHPLGPIRRWSVKANELHEYFTRLEVAAAEATGPNPTTRVNPECRDCKGRHACEALHAAADTAADIAGGTVSLELPPAALGLELRTLHRAQALLDARVTGLEAQATALLRSGKSVPFFQMGQSVPRETWTKAPQEIFALGALMGVDLTKPPAPITPAQARKAGIPADVVAGYAERPPGATKLIPEDTQQARKVFGK